ncbi:hypothetical protein V1L54_25675 [Streptomyces sp. TRM 70361]|uniref:hypothetical protein n=1 Tax=Streptomyces sp. TRM 70361 TaxID=3116553 RepID=UPI002E7B7C08|nr:hypothetical protein [Streptomyces sp. TRM 70361]MEE1942757.1 hypothetical protein [Streptomyces sp. TRM 70361]
MAATRHGGVPELSCYTTSLVAYLDREAPGAARRLAHAVRLAVRTDLPGGRLAFTHHRRIDRTGDGRELGYRGAARWRTARAELARELAARGAVLAVGNTRFLPWSPQYGRADVSHWLLLEDHREGRWLLTDHFDALLPQGRHRPYRGRLTDAELRAALNPPAGIRPEVELRDAHALGVPVPVPPATRYRWLVRQDRAPAAPVPGSWLDEPCEVLAFLADRLTDTSALAAHTDDLWAAARHQRHRITVLTGAGLLPAAAGRAASASWAELPRALRFAAMSAERGRARPEVVARALHEVGGAMSRLSSRPGARTAATTHDGRGPR